MRNPTGSNPIHVALVGLGRVADYHRQAIVSLQGAMTLAVGVDPSPERRAAAPEPTAHTLSASVLSQVDAVIIATPSDSHAELARLAIGAGKPVLLEKPAVTSWEDWLALEDLADRYGTPLQTAFHARFSAERRWYSQAKRWLVADHGPVCALHSQAFDPYGPKVRAARAKSLAGSWLDSGINILSGLDLAVDGLEVDSVRQVPGDLTTDISAVASIRFERRGLARAGLGVIETSWTCDRSWKETVLVYEESGARLHLVHSRHQAILETVDGTREQLFGVPIQGKRLYSHYAGVYREFLGVLRGRPDNRALSARLHRELLTPLTTANADELREVTAAGR